MLKLYKPQRLLTFLLFTNIIATALTSLNAQPWDGWYWRRAVTINNTSGSTLTNFQTKIVLNSSTPFNFANTNNDGSDLRVTSSDEVTQIPFWIESWNAGSQEATIWVKVPSIPTTGTTIYLYYGNTAAPSLSNGTNTFNFFDDFNNPVPGRWIRRLEYSSGNWGPSYVAHDWKYTSEMTHGALEYAIRRGVLESLDTELEQELNYIHSQISPSGTMISDPGGFLTAEPEYCYGLILSNLAVGYYYFSGFNLTLAMRCYNDMVLVFDYLSATYPTVGAPFPSDAGGYGWLLVGFSNAWRSLNDRGDATRTSQASTIVQNYSATFISSQGTNGSWTGAVGVQEHLKRDFGLLYAHQLFTPADTTYTFAVKKNMDYILNTFWISSNGGLEWYSNPATSDRFFECHQMWFMIAARRLYGRSAGRYNYITQAEQAWHFLTDNNYAGIDMYVDNYTNHNAFFSYRDVQQDGTFQDEELWKGSYEIGTALWGMVLNIDWVSNYQSSHSTQAYNYLNMMVQQIKNSPANRGYYIPSGFAINNSLWSSVGTPSVSVIQDNSNPVASFTGTGSHDNYIKSVQNFDNFILEMKVLMTVDANNNCTPEIGFRVTDNDNRYYSMLRGLGINDLFLRRRQASVNTDATPFPAYDYTANQYYKYKIVANSTSIEQHLNDVSIRTWNDAGITAAGGITLTNYGGSPTNPVYYDDVRIRSYASVEPSAIVGSEGANPLPVELNSFSASVIGSSVSLNWKTETEVNNYGFEVERKSGSRLSETGNFEKIGFVEGNGNSNSPKYYSFEDNNLIAGKYSYRLKQIDTDGKFEYSKVIEVDLGSPMKYELSQNYPNPFNPVTTIQFSMPEAGEVKLVVYNILGEQVAELINGNREAGVHTINFNATELNSGLYIYKLTAGNFSDVKKLMVVK